MLADSEDFETINESELVFSGAPPVKNTSRRKVYPSNDFETSDMISRTRSVHGSMSVDGCSDPELQLLEDTND